MEKILTLDDVLLNTAMCCTQARLDQLDVLINSATYSIGQAEKIKPLDVWEIKQTDNLYRLQHNTMALKMLLSMSKDAALCIRQEISDIRKAREEVEKEAERHRKMILAREEAERKYREKERKRKQGAAYGTDIEEQ